MECRPWIHTTFNVSVYTKIIAMYVFGNFPHFSVCLFSTFWHICDTWPWMPTDSIESCQPKTTQSDEHQQQKMKNSTKILEQKMEYHSDRGIVTLPRAPHNFSSMLVLFLCGLNMVRFMIVAHIKLSECLYVFICMR